MAYELYVECSNCGFHGKVEIKDGCKVEQRACPICGCAELNRDSVAVKKH